MLREGDGGGPEKLPLEGEACAGSGKRNRNQPAIKGWREKGALETVEEKLMSMLRTTLLL